MNAFHPDFIKTHYPDLFKDQIINSKISLGASNTVANLRKTKPNHGTLIGVQKATPVSLKPKEFMIFSRAGAPK